MPYRKLLGYLNRRIERKRAQLAAREAGGTGQTYSEADAAWQREKLQRG